MKRARVSRSDGDTVDSEDVDNINTADTADKETAAALLQGLDDHYTQLAPEDLQYTALKLFFSDDLHSQYIQKQCFRRILRSVSARHPKKLARVLHYILHDPLECVLTKRFITFFSNPLFRIDIETLAHPPHLMLIRALYRQKMTLFSKVNITDSVYRGFIQYAVSEERQREIASMRLQLIRHFFTYCMTLTQSIDALDQTPALLLTPTVGPRMRPYLCFVTLFQFMRECVDEMIRLSEMSTGLLTALTPAALYMYRLLAALMARCSSWVINVKNATTCTCRTCIFCFYSRHKTLLKEHPVQSFLHTYLSRVNHVREEAEHRRIEASEENPLFDQMMRDLRTMPSGQFSALYNK